MLDLYLPQAILYDVIVSHIVNNNNHTTNWDKTLKIVMLTNLRTKAKPKDNRVLDDEALEHYTRATRGARIACEGRASSPSRMASEEDRG